MFARKLGMFAGLTASLSLLVVGCGSSSGSGNSSTSSSSSNPITLTMLTHWDAQTLQKFQPYVSEYEKLHPNVKIDIQTVQFNDLLKKIGVSELSGNGPDIYHIYNLWLPELVKHHSVLQVPSDIAQSVQQGYGDNVAKAASVGNAIYGYPTEIDDYALIYNKALFKEAGISKPPSTWSELVSDAKKLTKTDSNGKIVQQGFGTVTGWDSGVVHPYLSLLQSDGGQLLPPDNSKAQLDSPQAKETLNLYKTLITDKVLEPQMSITGNSSVQPWQTNFETGRTAMFIMADWMEGGLKATMKNFSDVGTAPVPVGPSGSASTTVFYSWMYAVNSHSQHAQAAWDFLSWLNSPQASGKSSRMGDWLMDQGIIPSRVSDEQAHAADLQTPFMKPFVDELKAGQAFPVVSGGAEITGDLQKQIESVVFGQQSVNQALTQAQSQINTVLQQNAGN